MAYKGKIDPKSLKKPEKYAGDINNIVFRSLWERNVMYWLDENPNVEEWASEEIVFNYIHPLEDRRAKYYPDFYVKMKDGVRRVIEVKPKKETVKPVEPKRKSKRYMNEVATWIVNNEKWSAAKNYCFKYDMTFEIWTEETLDQIGIQKSSAIGVIKESKRPKMKLLNTGKPRPSRPRPTRKS